MTVTAYVESTEGLIAGIGGLMTGLAALLTAIRQYRRAPAGSPEGVPMTKHSKAHRYVSATGVLGVVLLVLSGSLLVTRAFSNGPQALNVELTTAGWTAFNKGDFVGAIANAEKCIGEFRGAADRKQAELEKAKVAPPPTGAVSSDEERKTIFARGLLNDVATCFFIKGRSAENLGRKDQARQAYESASKYTYARCWDPKGWFWSPAEASMDRLATLK